MATLKGIFPNPKPTRRKNFIHENVKNLRRMEQFFHSKEVDELQKLQLQKKPLDKYQNVASRINTSIRSRKHSLGKPMLRHSDKNLAEEDCYVERKISAPIESKNSDQKKIHRTSAKLNSPDKSKKNQSFKDDKESNVKRSSPHPNLCQEESYYLENQEKDYIKYRNQGIQTVSTEDIKTLYKEGAIRYPSSRSSKNVVPMSTRNTERSEPRECSLSPSDRGDISPTSPHKQNCDPLDLSSVNDDQSDQVKSNRQKNSVASKLAAQLNNGVLPSNYRRGVVPKYIRERKEAQQLKEEKMKAAAIHPDCPEGHVPLPDEERQETLRMLKKHHQEYVTELNMMPIKTDTLRSQRRKMEIEKQLTKLEEGIKVFSRPKVYVKVNA
ncbi:uncharacterized protein [Venturia canescens]|uniref:uncharacterized protein n=1 Tax=Venturia canescens TaxID=32260 RepID=UPI001C9BF468|nr:uncharacterized protein LOC122411208 [Venturia canescens]